MRSRGRSGARRIVLVVEDEGVLHGDLRQMLVGAGYDALAVSWSAGDAVVCVADGPPSAVHTDIRIAAPREEDEEGTAGAGGRWFVAMLHSVVDAVVAVDARGNITHLNPAAETLLHRTLDDVRGRPVRDLVRLLDSETLLEISPLTHVFQDRERTSVVEGDPTRGGAVSSELAHHASKADDELDQGSLQRCDRNLGDVDASRARLALADRLASLGGMVAGIAHDVNNPLASVMTNSGFALSEIETALAELEDEGAQVSAVARLREVQAALEDVVLSARRISTVVSDLSAFSRPPSGHARASNLAETLAWAVRVTAHERRRGQELVTDVADLPLVRLGAAELGQLLVNLLVNASHAVAPEGTAEKRIVVRASRDDSGRVVVEVTDTGSGMPPHIARRAFEPFFTTKPPGLGTGLGLAVTRAVVTDAGGEIQLETAVGAGTTVRVVLPAANSPRGSAP